MNASLRSFPVIFRLFSALVMLIWLTGLVRPAQAQQQLPETVEDFQSLVREYILSNPEIVVEALEILERRRQAETAIRQQEMLAENADRLLNSENHVVIGNPDGDVTLIEFFDYNCGFCRQMIPDIERLLESDKDLRLILKEFPVLGPGSQSAARVSIAAARLDVEKFLTLHKQLLTVRGEVNEQVALRLSERIGFDMDALRAVLDDPTINDSINEVYSLATDLGLSGTPTFIIGNEILPGAVGFDVLEEKIRSMRVCGETVCS